MSCYIVDNETLNKIVNGLRKYDVIRYDETQQVYEDLYYTNLSSVNARYNENKKNECSGKYYNGNYDDLDIYGAARCWLYQSDECPDFETNDSKIKVEWMLDEMLRQVLENKYNREMIWG